MKYHGIKQNFLKENFFNFILYRFVSFIIVHNFVQEYYRNCLAKYFGVLLTFLLLVTGNEREREGERERDRERKKL